MMVPSSSRAAHLCVRASLSCSRWIYHLQTKSEARQSWVEWKKVSPIKLLDGFHTSSLTSWRFMWHVYFIQLESATLKVFPSFISVHCLINKYTQVTSPLVIHHCLVHVTYILENSQRKYGCRVVQHCVFVTQLNDELEISR